MIVRSWSTSNGAPGAEMLDGLMAVLLLVIVTEARGAGLEPGYRGVPGDSYIRFSAAKNVIFGCDGWRILAPQRQCSKQVVVRTSSHFGSMYVFSLLSYGRDLWPPPFIRSLTRAMRHAMTTACRI